MALRPLTSPRMRFADGRRTALAALERVTGAGDAARRTAVDMIGYIAARVLSAQLAPPGRDWATVVIPPLTVAWAE